MLGKPEAEFFGQRVQLAGTGTNGAVNVPVTPGYTGTLNATVAGLVASDVATANVKNPTGQAFPTTNPAVTDHTAKSTVSVPEGTRLARFSTFDTDYPAGSDIDVYVYRAGTATLVGSSTGGTEVVRQRMDDRRPRTSAVSDERLQDVVARTRFLLLDFDGPVCSIFAGRSAQQVAEDLRAYMTGRGLFAPEVYETEDPLAVLPDRGSGGPMG